MIAIILAVLSGLSAAAPRCANGNAPRLSGDLFAPAECAAPGKPTPDIPIAPVVPAKTSLKELAGRWEGQMVLGMGRYELLAEIGKPSWTGKLSAVLKHKELQFRQRGQSAVKLAPVKGPGRYSIKLTADLVPGETLAGSAAAGVASSTEAAAGTRQLDALFSNGAAHRVRWLLRGEELRVSVWSAIPGAPPRAFETVLRRSTREAL